MSLRGSAAWLRPFLIVAVIVGAPLLLFAFVWVPQRVNQAEHQKLEVLAAVATKLGERLRAYDTVASQAPDRKEDLAYLEEVLGTLPVDRPLTNPRALRLEPNPGADGGLELRVKLSESRVLVAQVAVERLVRWELVTSSFDGLLVLTTGGALLGHDRRLAALPRGTPIDLRYGDQPVSLPDVLARRLPTAKPQSALLAPFADGPRLRARVAGIEYLALLSRVRAPVHSLDADAPTSNIEVVVCALLSEDGLRQQAIALPPQTLTLAIGALALGLLAIPFLKLRFIAARERMRPRDVWLLGAATVLGSAIAFLLLIQIAVVEQIRERFDEGLQSIAAEVAKQAEREADAAVSQLRRAAPYLLAQDAATLRGAVLAEREFAYPLFDTIFAAKVTGEQQQRWTAATRPTPRASIRSRDYLRNALALRDTSESLPAAFESVVALNTGRENAVFAVPADLTGREIGAHLEIGRRDGVVVLGTPFVSLNNPPVRAPYQFVVLDAQGRVIFQAAPEPFRDEHFYEAIASSPALARETLRPGADPEVQTVSYRGRDRQMLARPLPALGATLIAFYDRAAVESVAGQIFAVVAIVVLGVILLLLLAAWVLVSVFEVRASDWLWPMPERAQYYALGALMCAAAIALFAALHSTSDRAESLWWALPWPALAALAVYLPIRLWQPHRVTPFPGLPSGERVYAGLYVVFSVGLVMAALGLPLAVVFEDAFGLHMAAYRASAEAKLADAWAAPERQTAPIATDAANTRPRCESTQAEGNPFCTIRDRTVAVPGNAERLLEVRRRFARAPSHDAATPEARPVSPLALVASVAASLGTRSRELVPSLQLAAEGRLPSHSSDAPFSWARVSSGVWLGLLAALAGLALLMRSIAHDVLGLNRGGDGVVARPREPAELASGRKLLLRPPSAQVPRIGLTAIDLRDTTLEHGKLELLERKPWLILGLESRLDDHDWRPALLRLAANETFTDLVFVSDIDPVHYLGQRLREDVADATALDGDAAAAALKSLAPRQLELERWSAAFSRFEKVRFGLPERPADDARTEFEDRLWTECCWSQSLADLYRVLRAQPGLAERPWEEVVQVVKDGADPHYRSLWALCSRDEKLALIQLAEEGLANPRNLELMRRLVRRRLVRMRPSFRPMNDSFAEFVRGAEPPERVAAWERVGGGEGWARIGKPLWALGVMGVALLLLTEQQAVTSLVALAGAATTAMSTLRGFYAMSSQVVSRSANA